MAQLMNQICTPHLAYHYKILPHSVVIGIAVVLLILLLMSGWSALSYDEPKHLGLKICLFSVGTLIVIVVFVLNFWNFKTKTWYDATVNSLSTFDQEKQEVAKEYPVCVVIEERDDIDKPLYFVFCKDEITVNHINNQINRLENNGSVMFLNSSSNMTVINVTNFKKVKTRFGIPWPENRQYYAYLPQNYSIVDQPSILNDPAIESNIVNTSRLNGNLIKLFNGSN